MISKSNGLYLDGLAMRFGGVQVFADVTMNIPRAQVTACIGPNGAGKTTLINVVCGVLTAHSGRVFLNGKPLERIRPHQTVRHGIVRTFQDLRIFPYLTTLENVLIAIPNQRGEKLRHLFRPGNGLRTEQGRHCERASALLDELALTDVADRPAGELPFGRQKLLSLVRAIATDARFLLLDEPVAGLEMDMIPRVTALINKLAREGRAVLLVEHNVDVVREVANQVVVLQGGGIIVSGTCDQVLRDERVITEYLGQIYDA